jgi:carbamoyltransferase
MAGWVLGVSGLYHDAAAVLLRDGVVVRAVQEERLSRLKHDAGLPVRAARWCLASEGIAPGDLDALVFYEKPLRTFERVLATSVATFPRGLLAFPRQMRSWLGERLWLKGTLCREFGVRPEQVLFCEHHLSHAASAYYPSPHDDAAVLVVDGVGEWATTSLWHGTGGALRPVAEVHFPHSIGLFYAAITAHLGFAVNDGEYKVMGMAAWGTPRHLDTMATLLRLTPDGGFALDMDAFAFHWHPTRAGTAKLERLLGPPRRADAPFHPETDAESRRHADIAASAQAHLEAAMLHLARHARATVDSDTLCLAGGVALNARANHRLAAEGPHRALWIQPAAGDAGGAMGAALWAWHEVLGQARTAEGALRTVALGPEPDVQATGELLEDLGAKHTFVGDAMAEQAAEDLANGKVIAWVDGRAEWGPRALGQRSILADPRAAATRDRVNASVKFREPFRPFAPSILAEHADTLVEVPAAASAPARFMLTAGPVRDEARAALGAVTHVDGTARPQLVDASTSPTYHRLIADFYARTGTPAVLDTSLNLKGEAMVTTAVDAMATLWRSDLDRLYIAGYRVERPA